MFNKKFSRLIFIFTSVIVLIFLLSFFYNSSISPHISRATTGVIGQIDTIIGKPFKVLEDAVSDSKALLRTFEENKKLKNKISKLELISSEVKYLRKENEELRTQYNVHLPETSRVAAQIITRTPETWTQSIVIKFDKHKNIQTGMLVVSGSALVGRVSTVDKGVSHVDLLTCGKLLNLPIKIKGHRSVVFGNLMSYSASTQTMIASELNSNDRLTVGSLVYTSGLDGASVSDILIGKVKKVEDADDKLQRKVYISLSGNFSEMNYLSIVGKF
ncbi:rod shape-determining protein MreC [Streptococcus porcinus]|uniref:Cell shape-determining protein MreC n=2 Tax=Streptococcus porcinus TaxID=1340 RepID=A0A4V0GXP0_STRPO|nr:rod shape-determining protein MreC [Streptococcus porcinus]EGJ27706.1 rod shape-determining protein MreC [Streptococcus porcinus str. Jelinkova 176]SQG42239.1 rod shape-determining protein MreC [Streptococcus porcinus]VTT41390.1 rod shape-determining protein MreC [Streptococcus porcinus]VTT42040.1 rod shape-determining protein MreC [Streptococcus porcinus]